MARSRPNINAVDPEAPPTAFALKDCALIAIATGRRALTLRELLDSLQVIGTDSIYYHFWGGLLQPRFEEREFNNDLAAWTQHGLHDTVLAERLAVVDPTTFADLEALRAELVNIIEERVDESDYLPWVRATQPFEFIRSQIVVFDTQRRVTQPEELAKLIAHISPSSVFYHFVDARRRLGHGGNDFCTWLSGFGDRYGGLCQRLTAIDPYFGSLTELRHALEVAIRSHFEGGVP